MNKKIFFILILFTLFITITSVNAQEEIDNQNLESDSYSSNNDILSIQQNINENDDMVNSEKELKKDEKNKKESAIVNGIEYDNVVENQRISGKTVTYDQKTFINNCTSKAATRIYLQKNSAINNSVIESTLDIGGYYYYVYNSTLNCKIIFDIGLTQFYIDENTVIGENFSVSNTTRLVSNNTQVLEYIEKENTPKYILIDETEYMLLENKEYYSQYEVSNNTFFNNCIFYLNTMTLIVNQPTIINNSRIHSDIYNHNTLTINNSILNDTINNHGTLIIDQNTTLGEKFNYYNIGKIQTNNTAVIEYLKNRGVYIGNHIIENQTIEGEITNRGNLTIRNSTINIYSRVFDNYGNLTIENSTFNARIRNFGNLTLADDVIFGENCSFTGFGTYNVSNIENLLPYTQEFYGEYNINNITLNKNISNRGTLTFSNSTLNSTIYNEGILTISDDTIICENFRLNGDGDVIINDTSRIFEYQEVIKINMTFKDRNITFNKTFHANTIFINCNITEIINNKGNMTFINCSFSNNNMTTSNIYSGQYRVFLLDNQGIARLENCTIENNIFNYTKSEYGSENGLNIFGAILNNGTMTVVGSVASNNTLGYCRVDIRSNLPYGAHVGRGSVIANFGNLSIESSNFTDNYAGERGGTIYNEANLTVNNSLFENNLATAYGGAISSTYHKEIAENNEKIYDSQMQITNTIFKNNQVDLPTMQFGDVTGGGAIHINQVNTLICNCSFENNTATTSVIGVMGVDANGGAIAMEKQSGWFTNSTVHIENTSFKNHIANIITNGKLGTGGQQINGSINNCTFENNQGGINDAGNLNITNNTFKNTTNTTYVIYNGIAYTGQVKIIENNKFIDNNLTSDTIYSTVSSIYNPNHYPLNVTIKNNTYTNTTIDDTLNLTIQSTNTQEPITITGTYTINNPENYDADILEQNKFRVYVNGVLDQTVDTLEFTVTPTGSNTIVTVQPTISQTRKTVIIKEASSSNITITPENYDEYIYEGALIGVEENSNVTFNGTFTDKDEIYIDIGNLLINGEAATFTNTVFVLDNENITLENMNINNKNTEYPISNYGNNNIIANNNITLKNNQPISAAINNRASNTLIANNTLTVEAPAGSIDFGMAGATASTQAILISGGNNNTVQNNTINTTSTTQEGYGTLEAITVCNNANNIFITENKLNVKDANFNYAIDCLNNLENITITNNNILVTGQRYCDGIQVGNGAQNILVENNNITCICLNMTPLTTEGALTYGVIGTSMGSLESSNITINKNNMNLTGTANYAIELYKINKSEIHDNNITVTGPYSLGIGYSYAPNGNATGNTITITGDSTTRTNYITEEIKPENTGIRVQNGTQNIYLENNTIITSDVGQKDSTIHTDEDTVTIKNNKLISTQGYGDETIITFRPVVTMENNTITTTTTLEDISTYTNQETTLTVTVKDELENNVKGGSVTFTDADGNTIATAEVVDGTASTTATFQTAGESTITATYSPTSTGLKRSNNTATLTVRETVYETITLDEIEAIPGKQVTLTARIHYEDNDNITGGKITFKINGKTLKDANGKTIYAKVVNGSASVNYTIPQDQAGKTINITIIYSGSTKYSKETTTTTVTVTEATPTLTITPFTEAVTTGSTVTLKAKVALGDTPITPGKIVFKINGKTVKDANGKVIYAKVDANGEVSVDYTIPESFKAGTYNIEAVFTASGYEKLTDNTTMTVVKS